MNTKLIEDKEDWKDKIVKDYYAEYYPTTRVEKAIFNYLDQDYYASEDGVFFTIYKKENDWFVNKTDIEDEIKNMFGLTLPDRIKIGQDDYIEPARNPIPKRVIQSWVNSHLELKAHKEAMVHDKKKNSLERRNDRGIEEDLENWGFDGEEIGPIKEQTDNKLTNKFIKNFWPQHRSQLYRDLYNTYHPSTYVESFNRPSSNFENALETVYEAIREGSKLGLLDSPTFHNMVGKETGEMGPTFKDDEGNLVLNNQLEIIDNINLDWIHGILLFDVLEDIVDEFKHYCGENGIDESGMGKCMGEFPPSPNHEQINRTGGTLKQDYYTLFNFMRDLERSGIPVSDYMKNPNFPNIIKLVNDGTTDYNEEGGDRNSADWENMRTQTEFEMDAPSLSWNPDRIDEQDVTDEKILDSEIKSLKTQIDIDKKSIEDLEKDLKDKSKKVYKAFGKTKRFGYEDDDEDGAVIGIGRDSGLPSAFNETELIEQPENNTGGDESNWPEWKPDFELDDTTKNLETTIKKTNIDLKKGDLERKEKKLKDLEIKYNKNKQNQSTSSMGSDTKTPMGGEPSDVGSINIKKIVSVKEQEEPEFDEFSDEELEKRRTYDDFSDEEKSEIDQEYVDTTPFTKKEVIILKTLHKNLTRQELSDISANTPEAYGGTDKKFWNVMKLFGIEETNTEQNTRESRYAKWAYDNWTKDGDYGSIEDPIKVPLKWYGVEREESGSQIEYKSGDAEVLGFDSDDAGERADYDFYAWGGEMETNDYGDYESYDSEIVGNEFIRLDEQIDPSLKYSLNPNEESPILNVPPIKIAQKFSDVNGYGQIKFDMQGGNGIAYFTDKDLVIKLTADDSEYYTANKLLGTDNEYIVKVIESAKIKTSHSNYPIFVIVEEALPMTEEMEEKWSQCCCGVESPIHIDYLEEPALVLPPVSQHNECLPIYDNIIGIQKNFAEYGITWSDIGINNMGIKNGKLVVVDLGETRGQGSLEGKIVTLEHIEIRPLTSKQIKKQLVLI